MRGEYALPISISVMENAEEVMQLLEEFSKIKPKEIPRELEDYLGYVAKTGDPVYQWSLVKNLFREKLLGVITDFYESTLTVELPPCPNVEPFNYERMKTSLLERFDTFTSAPFTVQRICELLTNPRKEYNRADKYMRAIEKNILVVSTREPGTGKRPLECDSQPETVLNGMPDVKLNESDGSLLHVPTDLPYLGAPPASNDVTVETTEPNSTANGRIGLDDDEESKTLKSDSVKEWPIQESTPVLPQETELSLVSTQPETINTDVSSEEKCNEESDCDTSSRLTTVDNSNVGPESFEGEGSSEMFTQNNETVLPDSIDSSDSSQECIDIPTNSKLENEEAESVSDENEVSSTPGETLEDIPLIQEEGDEPADSEAEATDSSLLESGGSGTNALLDSEVNSSERIVQVDETQSISISEVGLTATKSDEVDLECNEITGTVVSPISPGNSSSLQADDISDQNINLTVLDKCEQPNLHPDSSDNLCSQSEPTTSVETENRPIESCTEADSVSETNVGINLPELHSKSDLFETPDQSDNEILVVETIAQVSSPGILKISEKECLEKPIEDSVHSSNSPEENVVSEGQCLNLLVEDTPTLSEVQSTSDVTEEIYDQERRGGSVIQSVPNITSDSQKQITLVEEISVDPNCEAEEEAMDVDDTSNQMMISEGENEGEPMDQCDQSHS